MKSKICSFLICFLLVLSCCIIAVTDNVNSYKSKKISIDNQFNSGENTDWWPMFHHDSNRLGVSSSTAPDTNNLLWNAKLDDDIRFSSNVIDDDRLYIGTAYFPEDLKNDNDFPFLLNHNSFFDKPKKTIEAKGGSLFCLDAKTGEEKWSFKNNGNIATNPVVVDDKVYFISVDYYWILGDIFCLDAISGEQIWNRTIYSYFTSPIVYDDKVYICVLERGPNDEPIGNILCLDASTGNEEWKSILGEYIFSLYSDPSFYDGKLYFYTVDHNKTQLYCLNSLNGDVMWITDLSIMKFGLALSSPVIYDDRVYVISGVTENDDFWTSLFCINSLNGDILWNYEMNDDTNEMSLSTPAVCDGKIYYVSVGYAWSYGRIYCHDALNGELIWDKKTEDLYTFCSPAISSDNKLLIGGFNSRDGGNKILCYDISDGSLLWDYKLNGMGSMDSSPAIADKKVFISSGSGDVYAFQDAFEIKEVSGGLACVKAKISNILNKDLNDVSWSISVTGGLFNRINVSSYDKIEILEARTTDQIRCFPVFGLGDVNITITVTMDNGCSCTKNLKAKVIGFMLKI